MSLNSTMDGDTSVNDSVSGDGYICPECSKTYANPDSLRKHAKVMHDLVFYYCRECKLAFRDVESKDAHAEAAHGNTAMTDTLDLTVS